MMFRTIVAIEHGRQIVVMDSMSQIETSDRDRIVIAASNGGQESGRLAVATECALAVLNDAGGGKEDAGIVGVARMGTAGVPGAAVSHDSAEISNGMDMWHNGVISYVNGPATEAGISVGDSVRASAITFARRFPLLDNQEAEAQA
ncbi:MAG: hypothetical protein AAGC80_33765 [Rhodococcus sp. (in: high G+C Gram-positive bacteria)]